MSKELLDGGAVDAIAKLTTNNTYAKTQDFPGDPDRLLILKPGGAHEVIVRDTPNIADLLSDPYELRRYIIERKPDDVSMHTRVEDESDPILLVKDGLVTYSWDFNDRRNIARVELPTTDAWDRLIAMAGADYLGTSYTQAELYRLLRVHFRRELPQGSSLPQLVREVKWNTSGEATSVVDQARRNLGVNLAANVKSKGEIDFPESFILTLNVYENFTFPISIAVDLDPQPDVQKFRLTPYPGEMENAVRATLGAIRELFDQPRSNDDATPVVKSYIGQ